MLQNWVTLTFLHWRCDAGQIQRQLPAGLTVDVFDGGAWIGLVPFLITGLRPPFAPELPWISNFPETNVRTYVTGPDGKPGVWFFTLEAARLAAVITARATFGLPYHWARMRVEASPDRVDYFSQRRNAQTNMRISIGDPIQAGELENFLTARFRLYSTIFGKLAYADVEHEPWPLHKARVERLEQNLVAATGEPLVYYSPGVHTRVGLPAIM